MHTYGGYIIMFYPSSSPVRVRTNPNVYLPNCTTCVGFVHKSRTVNCVGTWVKRCAVRAMSTCVLKVYSVTMIEWWLIWVWCCSECGHVNECYVLFCVCKCKVFVCGAFVVVECICFRCLYVVCFMREWSVCVECCDCCLICDLWSFRCAWW